MDSLLKQMAGSAHRLIKGDMGVIRDLIPIPVAAQCPRTCAQVKHPAAAVWKAKNAFMKGLVAQQLLKAHVLGKGGHIQLSGDGERTKHPFNLWRKDQTPIMQAVITRIESKAVIQKRQPLLTLFVHRNKKGSFQIAGTFLAPGLEGVQSKFSLGDRGGGNITQVFQLAAYMSRVVELP